MLDYEIIGYKVEYIFIGSWCTLECNFDTEEEAVEFVKNSRKHFKCYRLIQTRSAIIDF